MLTILDIFVGAGLITTAPWSRISKDYASFGSDSDPGFGTTGRYIHTGALMCSFLMMRTFIWMVLDNKYWSLHQILVTSLHASSYNSHSLGFERFETLDRYNFWARSLQCTVPTLNLCSISLSKLRLETWPDGSPIYQLLEGDPQLDNFVGSREMETLQSPWKQVPLGYTF